ncbi:beta-galactosidase [Crateriforma conspicua]|uniref:beta-galactosidase n=1 Tax=Crateriforma conspicua TaxID=2527996 RepID=UPI0018CE65B5|nr:beta-galactosidase [Crateriforma conspicua]
MGEIDSGVLVPERQLVYSDPWCPAGVSYRRDDVSGSTVRGRIEHHSVVIDLRPETQYWDVSDSNIVQVSVVNRGEALVWIEGRLDNPEAEDWKNSIPSQLHLLPGETGTLGIAVYRPAEEYVGPEIFSDLRTKPNGHRQHWRKFDPERVEKLRLVIRSAAPDFALGNLWLTTAYPFIPGNKSDAMPTPFLDQWGQTRLGDWPRKIRDVSDIAQKTAHLDELGERPASWSRYGGWLDGPKLQATGFFRVEKFEDRWWLVDPEGHLFWSHGITGVDKPVYSAIDERESLFEWLPTRDNPDFAHCFRENQGKLQFDFREANLVRRYGDEWDPRSTRLALDRLDRWGINTAAAWSSEQVKRSGRIPYTPVVHLWFPKQARIGQTPDPFSPEFETRLEKAIERKTSAVRDDPWCLGVFVGNEIQWPHNLVSQVLRSDANQSANVAFRDWLKSKYGSIQDLNEAWSATYASFSEIGQIRFGEATPAREHDFEDLYEYFAKTFFRKSSLKLKEFLPQHLYLGARIHVCPTEVAKAALEFVDVFSLNYYTTLAGVGSVPLDADKPLVITEYHFGALDRGVPGWGLMGVFDQRERSRAYAGYLISALQHPNIVGAHWFSYSDQSAVGNPSSNNQIGFVDIADQPYDEMVTMASTLGRSLYQIRVNSGDLMTEMENVISDSVSMARPIPK